MYKVNKIQPPPKPSDIDITHHDSDPRTHLLDSIHTISTQNDHDATFDKQVLSYDGKPASQQPKRHYLTGYELQRKQASETFWQPHPTEHLFVIFFLVSLALLLTKL